jgi:hypothetical protein
MKNAHRQISSEEKSEQAEPLILNNQEQQPAPESKQ